MSESQQTGAVERLLDRLQGESGGQDVSVGHILDTIGSRGAGPLLLVPALVAVSPVAAIPGLPTLLALVIVLFAAQILIGRQRIWAPDALRAREVEAGKVEKIAERLQPVAGLMDRFLARRLTWAAGGTATRVAAGAVILLCLLVPPLEVVPGAVVAPMLAIALIGLAMMVNDGIFMLIGLLAAAASVAAGLTLIV